MYIELLYPVFNFIKFSGIRKAIIFFPKKYIFPLKTEYMEKTGDE